MTENHVLFELKEKMVYYACRKTAAAVIDCRSFLYWEEAMKLNRRLLIGTAMFGVVMVLMGLIWLQNRPTPEHGEKHVVVEVVHKDQTETVFEYQTDHEYLGELLLETGLIVGTTSDYGLYVETVDGETADYAVDQSWWQLSCNGERAETGADGVVLQDGARYTWTYRVN